MMKTLQLGALLGLAHSALGCAAPPDAMQEQDEAAAASSSESERVYAALARIGFHDETQIEVDDARGLVHVDDIVFEKSGLLSGAYGSQRQVHDSDEFVEKGFRSAGLVSKENVDHIRLWFSDLTTVQTDGAKWAAQSWSATPNSRLRIALMSGPDEGGPSIHVRHLKGSAWPGPCKPSDIACAFFPSNGMPGDVYLNDGTNIPGCGWTTSIAHAVLLHEFGHAIGLTHPDKNDPTRGTLIPGTQDPSQTDPGLFPTIMWAVVENNSSYDKNSCMSYIDYPSNDDRKSVATLYPQ